MTQSYGLNNYYSHRLDISMHTSSGDVISFNFKNEQSSSLSYKENENAKSLKAGFHSMQSFQFSVQSNGIDAEDKKEIAAFMKKAQPYINKFLKELGEDAPKSPVTKIAKDIASIFEPSKSRDENHKNFVKTNIVKMFDKSLKTLKIPKANELTPEETMKKILEHTQKLLEKTLKEFDHLNKTLYA